MCLILCDFILKFAPRKISRAVIDRPHKADQNAPSLDALVQRPALSSGYLLALRVLPWRIVCLPQALAARSMLSRRGIANTLLVGVKRDDPEGTTDLHAWLSIGDHVIIGGNVSSYTPMYQLGSAEHATSKQ